MLKLLNKREEQSSENSSNFCSYFAKDVMCTCAFGRNNKSLNLLRYKILIHLITGMLDSSLNLSRDL